jgi:hypothetical protein
MPAMLTPNMGNSPPSGQPWAADNGRFTQPNTYSDERYLAWLARMPRESCLFATAPDVPFDALGTLALSLPLFGAIRALGYPVALVAQDGMESMDLPWGDFDVLFIGGTTAWKLSEAAASLAAEAKRCGKWVHMGRVNSLKRMRWAESIACDSADGTYVRFAPDVNAPRVRAWLVALDRRPSLWGPGWPK